MPGSENQVLPHIEPDQPASVPAGPHFRLAAPGEPFDVPLVEYAHAGSAAVVGADWPTRDGTSTRPSDRLASASISGARDCSRYVASVPWAKPTRDVAPTPPRKNADRVATDGLSPRLNVMLNMARRAIDEAVADAVLVLVDWPLDWVAVRTEIGNCPFLVASFNPDVRPLGAGESQAPATDREADLQPIQWVHLEDGALPIQERITMALLEAVANERLRPGASVVVLYSAFDADEIDSLGIIRLGEHLERLTAADLRKLETQVPLETLKAVVDLAVEIGREGREGHPVGALFVVGDSRKVMKQSRPMGFDPFHGYSPKDRNLRDRRVRDEIKEIAQLDGAIIIDRTGKIVAARRYIDSPATGITMSKGLGSRHWAAACISKSSNGIAIAVSQSSGTVRIFQNGQIMLRVEPLRRAMKWEEFQHEPPPERPPETD